MLAGAYAAGVAAVLAGAPPLLWALLPLTALLLPIPTSDRPDPRRGAARRLVLVAALAAGAGQAGAQRRSAGRDCRFGLADGIPLDLRGVMRSEVRFGRGELDVRDGLPGGCRVTVRVRMPGEGEPPAAGEPVRVLGAWRVDPVRPDDPARAGEVDAERVEPAADVSGGRVSRWRAGVVRRVREVFPRRAALVSALVLARKEGLDPALRDAFARSGTAHLLAISGFHVGVVAALLLAALRTAGVGRRSGAAAAALGVWAYVAFIGAPDAAVRAAVLLSLVAVARCAGRPLHAGGALSTAFLVLLVADPAALGRPGFQLSFAGAAGLVLGARPLEAALERRVPARRWRSLRSAVAAGAAATLATAPIAAWHFDRVALVGIPATLVGTPLVATAIPGIFAAMAVHALHPAAGAFLAGGVELLLDGLVAAMNGAAALPFAALHVDRPLLVAGAAGLALIAVTVPSFRDVRASCRLGILGAGAATAVLCAPVVRGVVGSGTVEVRVLDVGQGDAVAIRSPAGRWILVDTGPEGLPGREDPRTLPVVRAMGRAGTRRLEALVLTHAHLDHIGGAGPLLEALDVAAVADPGWPSGSDPYVDLLREAAAEHLPWVSLEAGDRLDLDGVSLRTLYAGGKLPPDADPNATSVVLLLRFGLFTALLTGDAPASVEEELAGEVGPLDLLKVGHHGSRTSSSPAFLEETHPGLAVISAGRRNRFGHPHPEVLERLLRRSGAVLRTDRDGTVRVVGRRDGSWEVTTGRAGRFD